MSNNVINNWAKYDVNPEFNSSKALKFIDVNGTPYFFAKFGTTDDFGLWKIDSNTGTPVQINSSPGNIYGEPNNLTNVNGTLYYTFTAPTGNGRLISPLMKVDPQTGIEIEVKNPATGGSYSRISDITNINGTIYFNGYDPATGINEQLLWKIDQTSGNPIQVKNLVTGVPVTSPLNLIDVNGVLYYTATDKNDNSSAIWKLDPATGNPLRLTNIFPSDGSAELSNLTNVNGTVYFTAKDIAYGNELWKLDPTTGNPLRVNDLAVGSASSNPFDLINFNGTLYFSAAEGINGRGLWKIDPNTNQAVQIADTSDPLLPQEYGPVWLKNVNGTLYFTNNIDPTYGTELYKLDPSTGKPVLVWDFNPGRVGSTPIAVGYSNGKLYVGASSDINRQLWVLDGVDNNPNSGAVANTFVGSSADDHYTVDSLGDVIIENSNGGIDAVNASVSGYKLANNVERLYLQDSATIGSGNDLDNALYGTQANNILSGLDGIDYLYGGAGADILIGGKCDDIYDVDTLKDVVVENANEGIDLVYASVSGYVLPANVERLRLYNNATSGSGNELDNALYGHDLNDTLDGKDGNDYINGGKGNDTMIGGKGNDIYDVDNLNDVIVENSDEGIEEVYASFSGYTLGDNLETLRLYGNASSGNGNALDNTLYGNYRDDTLNGGAGNDILIGGAGNDILTGGGGNDLFTFKADTCVALSAAGIDTIGDFTVGEDKIQLGKSIFSGLTTNAGILSINDFSVVTSDAAAEISGAAIVYNSSNGKLFYNADLTTAGLGNGGGQFAQLATNLALTNNQFEATF
jgi:ELWxxDGT repeat protein